MNKQLPQNPPNNTNNNPARGWLQRLVGWHYLLCAKLSKNIRPVSIVTKLTELHSEKHPRCPCCGASGLMGYSRIEGTEHLEIECYICDTFSRAERQGNGEFKLLVEPAPVYPLSYILIYKLLIYLFRHRPTSDLCCNLNNHRERNPQFLRNCKA